MGGLFYDWAVLSDILYGVSTLEGGTWFSSCGGYIVYGGIDLGGMAMLNIDTSCFNYAVCLFPRFVSGIFGVG